MASAFEMASRTIVRAPPERVWAVFRVVEDWPRWSRVCVSASRVSADPWAVGGRLTFRLRMAGVAVPFTVDVTESAPPHRVAWSSTKLSITATRTFTFVPDDGGTVVTDHKRFSSPLLPVRWTYPRWLIGGMTKKWLGDLKLEVERREPQQ